MSLDIEPDKVKHNPHGWMANAHLFDESQKFDDRIFVVERNHELRRTVVNMSDAADSQVHLSEFAAWTLSVGWDIPDELKEIAVAHVAAERRSTDLPHESEPSVDLRQRAEAGYLKTIGALLALLLKKSGATGKAPYPSQAAVIAAIDSEYPSTSGLSKRELEDKFARANESLKDS